MSTRSPAAGIHRRGFVTARDPKTCRVRVQWPELDDTVSNWLDVPQQKTRDDKAVWLPDIGEYVLCLMDDRHEDGYVAGALYSAEDTVPSDDPDEHRIKYRDGTIDSYNRREHHWLLDLTACDGTIEIRTGTSQVLITPTNIYLRADRIDENDDR
jgi:phage baseplate assembly protein V